MLKSDKTICILDSYTVLPSKLVILVIYIGRYKNDTIDFRI